jgi:hypothetical protein
MTLGISQSPQMTALVSYRPSMSWAVSGRMLHSSPVNHGFEPGLIVTLAGYVIVLLVLVVLGLVGWQGNSVGGNGGWGRPEPPVPDPPPPGGRELAGDSPPPAPIEADFAAWERQLQSADDEPPNRREESPVGNYLSDRPEGRI